MSKQGCGEAKWAHEGAAKIPREDRLGTRTMGLRRLNDVGDRARSGYFEGGVDGTGGGRQEGFWPGLAIGNWVRRATAPP